MYIDDVYISLLQDDGVVYKFSPTTIIHDKLVERSVRTSFLLLDSAVSNQEEDITVETLLAVHTHLCTTFSIRAINDVLFSLLPPSLLPCRPRRPQPTSPSLLVAAQQAQLALLTLSSPASQPAPVTPATAASWTATGGGSYSRCIYILSGQHSLTFTHTH